MTEGLIDYVRQEAGEVVYSFVHDQVQNAAINLLEPEKLPSLQLHLGQSLLHDEDHEDFDKYLYVALYLCNRGYKDGGKKNVRLARYNLLAGHRVSSSCRQFSRNSQLLMTNLPVYLTRDADCCVWWGFRVCWRRLGASGSRLFGERMQIDAGTNNVSRNRGIL